MSKTEVEDITIELVESISKAITEPNQCSKFIESTMHAFEIESNKPYVENNSNFSERFNKTMKNVISTFKEFSKTVKEVLQNVIEKFSNQIEKLFGKSNSKRRAVAKAVIEIMANTAIQISTFGVIDLEKIKLMCKIGKKIVEKVRSI
ncbi:MAG: hypothetical protein AB8B67_03930 [Rickettsiaceae bacterium]